MVWNLNILRNLLFIPQLVCVCVCVKGGVVSELACIKFCLHVISSVIINFTLLWLLGNYEETYYGVIYEAIMRIQGLDRAFLRHAIR